MPGHAPKQPAPGSDDGLPAHAPSAVAVTARSRPRFAPLRFGHRLTPRFRLARLAARYPDQAEHPTYDAALARELLTRTNELPSSRRALVVMLTDYRHALTDLTASPRPCQQGYADKPIFPADTHKARTAAL